LWVQTTGTNGTIVPLGGETRADTGHAVFHANSGGGIACASCHPEGGDDGRVWSFSGVGPRRTQSFRGGLLDTAPFHWDGDVPSLHTLSTEVFMNRMSGPKLTDAELAALTSYIDRIPTVRMAPSDVAAVTRGKALFENPTVGCAGCHSGPSLTNNETIDVGTGGNFQVPSLRGLALRAPFMHDGCARTLANTLGGCGGGAHGTTSDLSADSIRDLIAYLETL
jgi:cytochrome c peroxidase